MRHRPVVAERLRYGEVSPHEETFPESAILRLSEISFLVDVCGEQIFLLLKTLCKRNSKRKYWSPK